ncbi:MAG TPA: hypothetical protein DGH68_04030 [Bacteroidetes bacterium]|jgi:hypothetical protein|nr:hypothetical protein [Bacteroidota bacterium]
MPVPTLVYELKNWKGLNTLPSVADKDPQYVENCQNVDFDDEGVISKRRGCRRVLNRGARINCLYDFQKSAGFGDGTNSKVLVFSGVTLALIHQFDEYNTLTATFSVSNVGHYCCASNNGACYVSNDNGGVPKMLCKVGSSWVYQSSALVEPGNVPALATGGTGSLSGSYQAQYTYIDMLGNESNPSPESMVKDLAGQNLNVGIVASSDPSVSAIGIYVLTPNVETYRYVGTSSNTTTTYSVSVTDATIESGDELVETSYQTPSGRYVCIFNDMLLVAGGDEQPDQVYVSNWMFHRQFSLGTDYDRVTSNDGQPVRGFGYLYSDLIVAKADSLHQASGADNTVFHTRSYNQDYGALGQYSITGFQKRLVFYSDDGIYVDSGSNPEELSRVIRTTMRNLNPVALFRRPSKQVSAHYKYYKKLLFAVRMNQATEGENDSILVYNYELNTWTIYKGIEATALATIEVSDDYEFLYGGDSLGNVYQFTPPNSGWNSDNITGSTASISAFAETPWINLPKVKGVDGWERARTEAAWMKLYAGGEPAPGNSTISLQTTIYTDFNSATVRATYTTTHAATLETSNTPVGIANCEPKLIQAFGGGLGTFEWIKIRFTNNTLDEHFKIHKVVFGFRARPGVEE